MSNNLIKSNLLYFDLEYANPRNKSICQLGLKIENYQSKESTFPELNLYVNPDDEFDVHCVGVHHITRDKVCDAKTFDLVWTDIEKYFINSIVVGHNVYGADLDALCKNLIRYDIPLPEFYYIDTYEIARDNIQAFEIPDYKLSTLCECFGIDRGLAHDAYADADACSKLLDALVRCFDINLQDYVHHYEFEREYSFMPYLNSMALIRDSNILLGTIRGYLMDGNIPEEEKEHLKKWRADHKAFVSDRYGEVIISFVDDILADDILSYDEVKSLEELLLKITQHFSASVETRATQELQGIVTGIGADKKINEDELSSLQRWMYDNNYLIGHYPYDKIKEAIEKVIEDHIITDDEKDYLINLFDELFNPIVETNKNLITFENKEFCLSGDFAHGTKKEVEDYILQKGGIINSGVRKKTDYVVAGENGSTAYSNGNYGTKVKKAMEIGVAVITEKQLYSEI